MLSTSMAGITATPDGSAANRDDVSAALIALAGPPNVGKSTIFNRLTGLSQHVGNWPGKTVEQKSGAFSFNGKRFEIVDLPGTYSLTANSVEEQIARDFVIHRKPDVVIVVINAANLERTLYLVAEMLELSSPMVVALNMLDVAEREGMEVEAHVLEAALGVPVVPIVGTRGQGLDDLMVAVSGVLLSPNPQDPKKPMLDPEDEKVIERIKALIAEGDGQLAGELAAYPPRWLALKLLEGDVEVSRLVRRGITEQRWDQINQILRRREDAVVAIAGARYQWIDRMARAALTRPKVGVVSITERVDRVAAHPYLGIFVLLAIFGVLFWIVYQVSTPIVELLDGVVGALSEWLRVAMADAPSWLVGLLVDGVLAGVGTVLALLPILVVFFMAIGFLEDVGYMARAAFVADRFLHGMGLHGKSFLPLFLGFGCNVPSVMGSRILESGSARILTILLTPFVPCSARMAVLVFFTAAFFGDAGPLYMWGLVVFSLVVLAISGLIIHRLVFRGESPAFIMELPLYHVPNWRTIGILTWQRSVAFITRAGTIILAVSTAVWALLNLPSGDVEASYLAMLGRLLEPLGGLMGLDWRMMVALFSSFVAKEVSLATLGVLAASDESGLASVLPQMITPAAALSFLVAQMLFVPCAATVAAIKQETGSWRWTSFSFVYHLTLAFGLGIIIYRVAVALGLGG